MRIGGRILVIIATVLTAVSTLFCIIGLATKGWRGDPSIGLFCDGCLKAPAALSIISFLLLIATIVVLVLNIFDVLHGYLRYIPFVLLLISTIFLLGTFVSAAKPGLSYSFDLMVAAHFFSYVALAVTAYWYGQSDVAAG
jgi:hypothetical protein